MSDDRNDYVEDKNFVEVTGEVITDVDARVVGQNNTPLANFRIRIRYRKRSHFIRIVGWGADLSDAFSEFKKGDKVGITGRLSYSEYVNKEGVKIQTVEIVADAVRLIARGGERMESDPVSVGQMAKEYLESRKKDGFMPDDDAITF